MKQTLTVVCFLSLVIACNKQADTIVSNTNEETTKLMSITDSNGNDTSFSNFSYHYSGNQITDIYRIFQLNGADSFHYAHLDYLDNNHIRVTDPKVESRYVDYFLTDSKLPVRIIKQVTLVTQTTVLIGEETISFLYKAGTSLLDSISDSIPGAYYNMHYKFTYEGDNMSNITITQSFAGGAGNLYLHYTYDASTPNIFRHTDSLLYLLEDPFLDQMSTTYIPSKFLVETFSASTYHTIEFTGDADPSNNYSATLNYTLTKDGRIATVGYNGYTGLVYAYK